MASTKKKKDQENHANDLLENPEALADQLSKTEEFVNNNKALVLGLGTVLVLLVAGYFGFSTYKNSRNEQAQNDMFQAIYYFEADSLDLALNGDGINYGFLKIIDEYGITDAANLANFYAGSAYLKQGSYKSAILYLEDFKADDLLIQARAYSLIGDANMELGEYNEAASYYEKAANYEANKYFSPRYLMKAAVAYENANDLESAKNAYTQVIEKYWDSAEVQNAKKYKAKLDSAS